MSSQDKPSPQGREMKIEGLVLDPSSNVPIVILREEGSREFLPIWIGLFEANAIALQIKGVEPPRPLTHDLLLSTIKTLGAEVVCIVICDLQESTFHARIEVELGDEASLSIDSRPSDAMALALRAEVPIFVDEEVFEKAKSSDHLERDEEKIRQWLEEVDPDDLGEYEM